MCICVECGQYLHVLCVCLHIACTRVCVCLCLRMRLRLLTVCDCTAPAHVFCAICVCGAYLLCGCVFGLPCVHGVCDCVLPSFHALAFPGSASSLPCDRLPCPPPRRLMWARQRTGAHVKHSRCVLGGLGAYGAKVCVEGAGCLCGQSGLWQQICSPVCPHLVFLVSYVGVQSPFLPSPAPGAGQAAWSGVRAGLASYYYSFPASAQQGPLPSLPLPCFCGTLCL